MNRTSLQVFLVGWIMLMLLAGCTSKKQPGISEGESLQTAMKLEDPVNRAAALEAFVKRFPESKQTSRAYRELFNTYLEVGDEEKAVAAAEKYLEPIPENRRGSAYNFLAWSLAVENKGLKAADKYSALAEQWARQQDNPRTLQNILDTRAYVLYRLGDAASALKLQEEALKGNEQNADFLSRLALYQEGVGNHREALKTAARCILYGGGDEDVQHFFEWLPEAASTTKEQQLKERIVLEVVNNFMPASADRRNPDKLSQAALLLAKTGVALNKAEKWAQQAFHTLKPGTPTPRVIAYRSALAKVYFAKGKYHQALEFFKPVEKWALPWQTDTWYTLGQLYEKTGDNENAIAAYIQGLVYQQPEKLMKALADVYQQVKGSTEGIPQAIEQARQALLNFEPGRYQSEKSSGRVVLAELFTGAECPPCAASDKAFDALADYFPRANLAILEYHLHIPAPDPMTNPDTEARYRHYGANFGTPTAFLNGTEKLVGGGPLIAAKHRFVIYRDILKNQLEIAPPVEISGTTSLNNDQVHVKLKLQKMNPKKKFSLATINIALVEKIVNYPGGNGVSQHRFVVRRLFSNANGDPIHWENGEAEIEESVSLPEVETRLEDYLNNFVKQFANRFRDTAGWREKPTHLDRTNLAVVAWVQDAHSNKVLQAWYRDVTPLTAAK